MGNWPDASAACVAALVAALATLMGSRVALRHGWIDHRGGEQVARKPRTVPVPLVGGAALLLGFVVAANIALDAGAVERPGDPMAWPWLALAAAFTLGLIDDLRREGLSARVKFGGQVLVASALALDPALAVPMQPGARGLVFVVALVAQNAINTFDNADGAATSLALVGLFPVAVVRGALLGFLPFNLLGWRRAAGARVPLAYLGDSGSHLLGVCIAAVPAAWPVLVLPVLDLARLSRLRLARGRAPWQGDRSHLAHRLMAADWPGPMVALTLAAVGGLPVLGALTSTEGAVAGVLGCVLAFSVLVAATPDPEDPTVR
ncbi:MAG: UDP-GlcNAc:undecaprenyl-phosphate GlcNAc-1-phosphate transferase [Chlamydiales bacterium]|jgi:UDP-GlcNAc:undecaprenyl-phosphate GlcNAc-1-phosphate transferase